MSCIHDFQIKAEDDSVIVEKCKLCGEEKRYNKVEGKIDNKAYLKDHARDFCQPSGRTGDLFNKLYGSKH